MFSGAPYIVTMIDIPQRYQTSNISALSAGIRLIPFNFMVAFGAVIVNVLAGKTKIPPIVLVLFGAVCQLIGVSLLAFMKYTTDVPSAIYGYQVVLGLGIGFVFGINYLLPSAVIKIADPGKSHFPSAHGPCIFGKHLCCCSLNRVAWSHWKIN